MIDRKMRKNEKEGVMQRENERIIYHFDAFLMRRIRSWSERPLFYSWKIWQLFFDILDLDDRSIQRIDHKKANKEQWSDQFFMGECKEEYKTVSAC